MSQNTLPTASYDHASTAYETKTAISLRYNYWRLRLTYTLIIGYAAYYVVRQNFTIIRTSDKCPFSMEAIGWSFSAFSIIYGIFKFVTGAVCDRSSSRFFMPIGLALAALCSFLAGCCNSAVLFGLLYAVSAGFQSMGWPSVSRTLTQWFGPRQLGTRWGIVNSSHQIGAIAILIGGAWLLERYSWRYLFIVPACICFILSFWLWERLRDTPESIGLPSLEEHEGLEVEKTDVLDASSAEKEPFFNILKEHILFNYRLWMVCVANFFVYFVRAGLACWGPVIITQTQNCSIMEAGCKVAGIEAGGLIGGLFVGWFTDKFMPKRRGICGAYMMILLGILIAIYWIANTAVHNTLWLSVIHRPWVDYLFWTGVGFLVYGPQTLGGLSGAEFGSKKAAAAAAGLTGTVGYLAASVSGIGLALLARAYGWQSVYLTFVISSFFGGIFFALTLRPRKRRRA